MPVKQHYRVLLAIVLFAVTTPELQAQELPPPAPQPGTTAQAPAVAPTSATADADNRASGSYGQASVSQPDSLPARFQQAPQDDTVIVLAPGTTVANPQNPGSGSGRPGVGGCPLGKLGDWATVAYLERALAPQLAAKVTLSDGIRTYQLRRDELGATAPLLELIHEARDCDDDVPLRFSVAYTKAAAAMTRLATLVNRAAAPASLDVVNGQVVQRGGPGVEMSVDGSAWRVKLALESHPPLNSVELVVNRTAPEADSADLTPYKYLLAQFTTVYDASLRGRTNNLGMAARNVDGTVIPAGEVFSANAAIGRRDADAGWEEAKMFVDGQVVTGVGAGICQCASTLYNTALLAGLPIIERHQHMFRVTYVPASRDATLYWGEKDLRFRNTTSGPIYVQTFLKGEHFHARFYGVEPGPKGITIVSHTVSRDATGTHSVAYRIFKTPTGERRELLSHDFYKPHPPDHPVATPKKPIVAAPKSVPVAVHL